MAAILEITMAALIGIFFLAPTLNRLRLLLSNYLPSFMHLSQNAQFMLFYCMAAILYLFGRHLEFLYV
jgi:hypothetical protein